MTITATTQPLPAGWVKAPSRLVFSLPGELLGTYLRIRHYDRGQGCWASLDTLGAGRVSERQLRRHLRELERQGLIQVSGRSGHGTLIIRCVETPDDTLADLSPAMSVRSHRTSMTASTGHGCPVKQIPLREEDPIKNNLQATSKASTVSNTKAVVVSSQKTFNEVTPAAKAANEATIEQGAMLALHVPEDLVMLATKRKGLSVATVRRLMGLVGVEAVRAAAGVLVDQYPDDGRVKSFGALLTRAVQEGWRHPEAERLAERAQREAAITSAAPPAMTRWALAPDGRRLGVVSVTQDVVKTDAGSVIPREQWPAWTWLGATAEQEPTTMASHVSEESSPQDERRCRLAMVAASLKVRRLSPERLAEMLARHGLDASEMETYLAETP